MTYEAIVDMFEHDSDNAIRPSPGKFEGNGDVRIAEALYALTLDSAFDDQAGDVHEHGLWVALIGRFVVTEDSQGFFGYVPYPTEDAARLAFTIEAHEIDAA